MIPKIKSKEEIEKKERKTRLFMAVFVTVILGASTAAYALMDTNPVEKKKYNDFTFYQTDEGWKAKNLDFTTSYIPQDVENISVSGELNLNDLSGNAYLIAFGNKELSAATELVRTLPLEKVSIACAIEKENESFCYDLPIKSCEDAASGSPVIIFSEANESSVAYNSYCLEIKSNEEEAIKAADRVIFGLYDVI
jgi:hypothetical protein